MKYRIFLVMLSLVFTLQIHSFAEPVATITPLVSSAKLEKKPGRKELPFSLTISGGISLGSYEAGINWALIEYMKKMRDDDSYDNKPELKVVTGASAGAINAVLSAMLWSLDEGRLESSGSITYMARTSVGKDTKPIKNTVEDNLIRNTWTAVGFDELLPKNISNYCNPKEKCHLSEKAINEDCPREMDCSLADSIFARDALKPAINIMTSLLKYPVFLPHKNIYIALRATRVEPIDVKFQDLEKFPVPNQRFVFLLQFKTDDKGWGHFVSEEVKLEDKDSELGTAVYLPHKRESYYIALEDVIHLMFASSAFPVAFSKVYLDYCTKANESSKDSNGRCPKGTFLTSSDFMDGGVFDNIPLGTALSLINAIKSGKTDVTPFNVKKNVFFFISPSTRREVPNPFKDPKPKQNRTFGIEGILDFVPGSIDAAAQHELYTVLGNRIWTTFDNINKRGNEDKLDLFLTDRYFPVIGNYMGHFGAFFDEPLRDFDYGVGVYDAVIDLAKLRNHPDSEEREKNPEKKQKDAKIKDAKEVKYIYGKLFPKTSSEASAVFSLVATQEYNDEYKDPNSEWHWINDILPSPKDEPNVMHIIFNSIIASTKDPVNNDDTFDKTFKDFIKHLKAENYDDIVKPSPSETMKWIIENREKEYTVQLAPLVGRAGERLQKLQAYESDTSNSTALRLLAAGMSLGLGRTFNYDDSPSVQPSSVSHQGNLQYFNLIPYEIGSDLVNGGVYLSYLGQIKTSKSWSIDWKFTPYADNNFGGKGIILSQLDIYASKNRISNVLSIGGGFTGNYLWREPDEFNRANTGFAVYGELFQTLRLTFGLRTLNAITNSSGNGYVTLGLVDLPGLVERLVKVWN